MSLILRSNLSRVTKRKYEYAFGHSEVMAQYGKAVFFSGRFITAAATT
jgi:hypothetical protein